MDKKKIKRRRRMYVGKPPVGEKRLIIERRFKNDVWQFWLRPASSSKDWLSLKICVASRRLFKANVWVGWHRTQQRFSQTHDYEYLLTHEKALLAWFKRVMLDYRPGPRKIA